MEKIGRTKIVDLLKRTDIGAMVNVKGWVRTRRGSKQVNFIALNDGSTINNLQVVVDLANFDEEMLKLITTGACISVNGEMVESVGSGQKVEGHSMEFLREIAHLRPRTNTFGAVFRIRHNMAIAIHKFFHEKGFFYFHTPIITASDCEGAGQMFQVTTMNLYDLKKDERGSISYEDDFFGKQASLTVSGQLEGELAATFERTHKYDLLSYVLLAMPFIYPLVSLARGLSFPEMTSPVMPCSVVVFTIGLLLLFAQKVNMFLVLFLCHWSLIGLSKTYFLLASATIPGLYLFFREYFLNNLHADTKPKAKYINWLLISVCVGLAVLLTTTMFLELVPKG